MNLTERLRELFLYDPLTGWFTYRVHRSQRRIGTRAGSPSGHGYRRLGFDYIKIYEHQAAWLYIYDEWPPEVDHRDGDKSNNALANLRIATRTQNNFNSKREPGQSGLRGAYLDKRNLQWYSKIQIGGQVKYLGAFDSAEEAHQAFMKAVELHHGEFAFHKPLSVN